MNRDIKFRGIRIDTNPIQKSKWAYGYLIIDDSGEVNIVKNYGDDAYSWDAVVPESVGQYTGLKDRNGKEIYEGDILEFDDMGEEGFEYREGYDFANRAVVTFENGRYTLDRFMDTNSGVMEELRCHDELYETLINSEVIGNIYSNSELLEVSNDR